MAEDIANNPQHASGKTHAGIEDAADRVKQRATDAAQATKDKVGAAADHVERGVHRATDASARGAHRVADGAVDLYDCTWEFVREKPVQSVAIALVAGWLIGRLLSRRG